MFNTIIGIQKGDKLKRIRQDSRRASVGDTFPVEDVKPDGTIRYTANTGEVRWFTPIHYFWEHIPVKIHIGGE